jgi:alkylhydroperoxidase family enzyme
MARMPYLSWDQLPEDVRQALQPLAGMYQKQPSANMMVLSASPQMVVRLMDLTMYLLRASPLDPKLRELAILKLSRIRRAPYVFGHHVVWGLKAGLSREQVKQVDHYKDSPLFDEAEKLVLEFAEQMTMQLKVADRLFWKARRILKLDQLVDLITAIGLWNGMCAAMNGLEIDPEPSCMEILEWSWN